MCARVRICAHVVHVVRLRRWIWRGAVWTIGISNPGMCTEGVYRKGCLCGVLRSVVEAELTGDLYALRPLLPYQVHCCHASCLRGVQDRHITKGLPHGRAGGEGEAQAEDTSPTLPELDILGPCASPQLTLELAGFSPTLVNPALLHHRRQAMSWGRGPCAGNRLINSEML